MKILVTGGAGFIGSNVVDGYAALGHEVVVVDNLATGRRGNITPTAKFYNEDIRDRGLKGVFEAERPDIVNHHAAQISVPASVEDPLFDADVNVLGFLNVLECSKECGVKKIIFASSGGAIYGETGDQPAAEDQRAVPLSPYGIAKLVSEHYLHFYRHQYGLDFTVLRYANIYGPRQIPKGEAGVAAIFMEKIANGGVPTIFHYGGVPDGMTRDYCYVEDVVEANLLALEKGSAEVFNIGSGVGTTTAELYRGILGLMRDAGYARGAEFDSPPRGPARPGDLKMSRIGVEKARRLLGWSPGHDLRTGLEKTRVWFKGAQTPLLR